MHYFIARLLHPKMIRKKWWPWPVTFSLLTYFLVPLNSWGQIPISTNLFRLLCYTFLVFWNDLVLLPITMDISQLLLHISSVLRCSGTSFRCQGLSPTAFSHISFILKWSETSANKHGSFYTALLPISCVLKWSGTFTNDGSFLTALLHILCFKMIWGTHFI